MTNPPNGTESLVEQGEQLARTAAQAQLEFQRHVDRVGADREDRPGQPFPTLDDAYGEAMEQHETADAALEDWTKRWWADLSPEEQRRVTGARQADG